METFLLCIPNDNDTYNYLKELYIFVNQDSDNSVDGFILYEYDSSINGVFYIIPSQYYEDFDSFISDYYNKVLTINDLQIYTIE